MSDSARFAVVGFILRSTIFAEFCAELSAYWQLNMNKFDGAIILEINGFVEMAKLFIGLI